jgi:hypothetical protein
MKIFQNDVFKTALVVVVLFLTIPFVMPSSTQSRYEEEQEALGMPRVKRSPFAKILERISDFYGLNTIGKDKKSSNGDESAAFTYEHKSQSLSASSDSSDAASQAGGVRASFDAAVLGPGAETGPEGEYFEGGANAAQSGGQAFRAVISKIGDNEVELDFNHPLAGKKLHFSVEVVSVK